ncbi:MAG: FAD-dependent oxidoreductase [Pseudomonadota bacterium]
MSNQLRIAIVGGGISGIAAAHKLSERYSVTLFEASDSLGGHAHAETILVDGNEINVDTAFLIFNSRTYPLFSSFVEELGLSGLITSAEMSSCFDSKKISYSLGLPNQTIRTSFRQFTKPQFIRLFFDLWRFRKNAAKDYKDLERIEGLSIGMYLKNYSITFREHFALPLMTAIWSLPVEDVEHHPAANVIRYFGNHSLLEGSSDRLWQTFLGSSRVYIDEFKRQFRGKVRLGTPIKKIVRSSMDAVLHGFQEDLGRFDRVILATHADTALSLLEMPSLLEERLLGAWKYRSQAVTLHHDSNVLHKDPKYWGSWNMNGSMDGYRISYYLNRLQKLPVRTPVILSLGDQTIDPRLVRAKFTYRHPVFSAESVSTQPLLPHLNTGITAFCGSYFGYGFHEDGLRSGLEAAKSLMDDTSNKPS